MDSAAAAAAAAAFSNQFAKSEFITTRSFR
jgi:hypothetical protein